MFDFIKQNPLLWLIVFLLIVSPSFLFGAFQVVAIIICIIMLLVMIGVLALRWKIYRLKKEMDQNQPYNSTTNSGRFRSSHRAADDIDIKIVTTQTEKKVSNDVGDYVEFEEIKNSDKK